MTVQALKKSYGLGAAKVEVLRGIDLQINKGETLALIGKSGSGKSTLLSLLAGLDQPDSGKITIGDKDLSSLSETALTHFRANSMGIVFQQFHLVSTLTALENVLLPLELLKRDGAGRIARELLESVGLGHRAHHLPSELSGGESQRVAIARALAIRPAVLFADEPSGNLDEETGEKVMDLLFKMVKETDTTMILVTHDPELAAKCSRVIHLEHGALL
ncbi:MAG TPA: ABC transporter ATP-binding protein [Bacteriovoracaceae bacterium]|nr:ABC transporter ATP-binding protein [Bacteriovoracaceae bacterium]